MPQKTGARLFVLKLKEGDDGAADAAPSSKEADAQKRPALFDFTFYLAGSLDSTAAQELTDLIRANGGEIADAVAKSVTCVVATDDEDENDTLIADAKEVGVPGVGLDFVRECVENGSGEDVDMTPHLLWGEARTRKRRVQETVASTFVEKRGVQMDTDVGELKDKAHVLVDKA